MPAKAPPAAAPETGTLAGQYSALEALAELARLGAGGAEVSRIADLIVHDAQTLVGSDFAALMLVAPDYESFTTVAVAGNRSTTWHESRPMPPNGSIAMATRSGRAVVRHMSEVDAAPNARLFTRDEGAATWVCAPILTSPGVLFLGWRTRAEPTPEQISIAETLASYAGTILEGARARQAEAECSAQLTAIVNHLPSGVLLADRQGRPVLMNDAMRNILGSDTDVSMPLFEQSLHREWSVARSAVTGKALAPEELPTARALAGECEVKDILLLRRPGEIEDTCLMVSSTPLRDHADAITGALTVMTDVTNETLLQRQVKAYSGQLERVYDSMACGVVVVNKNGMLYANRAARTLLSLPLEGPVLLFRNRIGALLREDGTELPIEEAPGRTALRTGETVRGHLLGHRLSDGSVLWTQEDAVPVCDEQGNVELAIVSMVDVTERKETRQALQDQFTFLHATMASLGEGLYASDENGCLVLMNRAAEEMLGWTQAELFGKRMHEVIHHSWPDGSALPWEECPILQARLCGVVVDADDEVFARRDGSLFPVSCTASALKSQGKVSGVVVAFRDISEQKQAEAALRASEDRFRDLVDHSWDIICTHDAEGKALFLNQAAAEILGVGLDELIGRNVRDMLAPEVRDQFDAYLETVLRDGVATGLMRVVTRGGERRLWEYRNTLRTAGVVRPVVRAMARDVTETHRAEQELRRSEARFRALIEDSSELIALTDERGVITYVSPAIKRLLGNEPAEVQGRSFAELVHPDDAPGLFEALDSVLSEPGKRLPVSYRSRHRDGSWRHLRGVATNLLHDPAVGAVVGNVWDVTDVVEAQKALQDSEERYRIIVETAFEGVWAIDRQGKTTFANDQMARMLGCSVEELYRRSVFDFVDGDLRPTVEARLRRRHAGLSERYECRYRRSDGMPIWALVSACPLRWANSEVIGSLAMMTDITERKNLEAIRRQTAELEAENQRIAHSSEVRARFFATMSHELRSPLNAIIGMAELLEQGSFGALSPRQKEMAGRLLGSSEHLLKLVNGVLDLAKLEAGKLELDPEPLSLRAIVGEVIATLTPQAEVKRLRVDECIEGGLDHAYLDVTRLRQVLYNYLSNAIKFSPIGGTITVRLAPTGQQRFRIQVEDEGAGICPDDLAKLFREFEQLPNARENREKGTGLGLAITKRIVEAQGGQVGATSRDGHGSVFYADLPLRLQPESLTARGR